MVLNLFYFVSFISLPLFGVSVLDKPPPPACVAYHVGIQGLLSHIQCRAIVPLSLGSSSPLSSLYLHSQCPYLKILRKTREYYLEKYAFFRREWDEAAVGGASCMVIPSTSDMRVGWRSLLVEARRQHFPFFNDNICMMFARLTVKYHWGTAGTFVHVNLDDFTRSYYRW